MGLTGPVPTRVDATVKAGLLELVSESVEQGWSTRRACSILEVDDLRLARWMIRREDDQLDDLPPGGNPVHALMPSEVKAILELVDEWSEIDRSHRKLAHRGSRLSKGVCLCLYIPQSPCGTRDRAAKYTQARPSREEALA